MTFRALAFSTCFAASSSSSLACLFGESSRHSFDVPTIRLTIRRSQRPLSLSSPLARFTSEFGRGSAFFVRHHARTMKLPTILFAAMLALSGCSRTSEFKAQALAGQPIVRAIEDYRKQTGSYPPSLAALTPKYLATVPDIPDESQHKFTGWDYRIVTNGTAISFSLRYYMGRGGVEYQPPNWIGNDEGHTTVVLSNQ